MDAPLAGLSAIIPHVPANVISDLLSFHRAHFGSEHGVNLLPDGEPVYEVQGSQNDVDCTGYDDNYNELGYYDDGVKRTLTDEQIAIFRHSELRTLRKQRDEARPHGSSRTAGRTARNSSSPEVEVSFVADGAFTHEGEVIDEGRNDQLLASGTQRPMQSSTQAAVGKRKAKKGKKRSKKAQHDGGSDSGLRLRPQPDLRKRTWDKVETGLGNLDYDETQGQAQAQQQPSQRRRITYDED